MVDVVNVRHGSSPVILALPHSGTYVPEPVARRLNANGRLLSDTDWHLPQLYEALLPEASVVAASHHRYVIDVNRDPSGASLYPGQNTTGLVPLTDFDNQPIWERGQEPDATDTAHRSEQYHRPYHAALASEIERVKAKHGVAVLYDCHSIRSVIPFLFDGVLPDFNIGTNHGKACDSSLERAAAQAVQKAASYTHVINGRFVGGWTTRHYGRPEKSVHAIQMELAQSTHLTEQKPPFSYDSERAERLRHVLATVLADIQTAAQELAEQKSQ